MLNKFIKGFRKPKALTRKQKEKEEKANNFIEGYKKLCAENGLQLKAIIQHEADGSSKPSMVVAEYQAPQLKNWADATAENLEVQKNCRHLNENNTNCKTCGVRLADQDPSGTGVTEEFIKIKLQKIEDYRAKDK